MSDLNMRAEAVLGEEGDCDRLLRWAASLRRTSEATRAEAERHGAKWEFYDLSLASSAAQAQQAELFETQARAARSEP